jgi:hypothetical protein
MQDDGGSAFPIGAAETHRDGSLERVSFYGGMTLRDYFAAKALQGYISDGAWRVDMNHASTARAAYHIADAMLEERNKT